MTLGFSQQISLVASGNQPLFSALALLFFSDILGRVRTAPYAMCGCSRRQSHEQPAY